MRQDQNQELAHSIAYVVNSFQNTIGNYDAALFERYCNIAIEEYAEFGFFHLPQVEVCYITVNDALIGNLPSNFAYYTKVGVEMQGNLWTLSVNKNLIKQDSRQVFNNVNDAVGAQKTDYAGYTFADHFRNGTYTSGLFATGGGFNRSYFDIDEKKKIIVLSRDIPSKDLVVEYVSNGLDRNAKTLIPAYAVKPLRLFLRYTHADEDENVGEGVVRRRLYQYEKAVENMRLLANKFTLAEYLDSMYGVYKQGPKR